MSSPRLAAALAYADHGWHVFPLGPNKVPLGLCDTCRDERCPGRDECTCSTDTCHSFYAATTDSERIRRWYAEHPEWMLGIRTGERSGVIALDVDFNAGGDVSLRQLQRRTGLLPRTVTQVSGSGQSIHLLFAHPGHKVSISAGKLGPGLDVRADGGYICAAPTLHPNTGRPYTWDGHPFTPLAVWPEALDELLRPPPAPLVPRSDPFGGVMSQGDPSRRAHGVLTSLLTAPEGQRNAHLYWAACRFGEMVAAGEMEVDHAVDALYTAGRHLELTHVELVGAGSGGTIFSGLAVGRLGVSA